MKKSTTNALVDIYSPRKISTFSGKKVSSAVSPAHTSYRAPLYNIQLEESDNDDKRK